MDLSHILGYCSAFVIGIVLGMLGGGGSMLTVPVMVYLFSLNPITATAYSLFVVGVSALSGVIRNFNNRLIVFKIGIVFAIPSFIAVYLTRKYFVPAIPEILFSNGPLKLSRDVGLMLFFAIIMLYVAISMIKQKEPHANKNPINNYNYQILAFQGLIVGILTGIVGAGGGFLIIPALVLLAKLPMKSAVATSLFIIAIKSLIGFIGDIENIIIDWKFLLIFTTISVFGILFGIYISKFVNGRKLKKMFGWLVLSVGVIIIIIELS